MKKIKALTVQGAYPHYIATGLKSLETRRRRTSYRGELLICAGKREDTLWHSGWAVCVVNLVNCRPMRPEDEPFAMVDFDPKLYVYELTDVRRVMPFTVRGMPGFFEVDKSKVAWQRGTDNFDVFFYEDAAKIYETEDAECIANLMYLAIKGARYGYHRDSVERYAPALIERFGKAAHRDNLRWKWLKNATPLQAWFYLLTKLTGYAPGEVPAMELLHGIHSYNLYNDHQKTEYPYNWLDGNPCTVRTKDDWAEYWSSTLNKSKEIIIQNLRGQSDWSTAPVLNILQCQ